MGHMTKQTYYGDMILFRDGSLFDGMDMVPAADYESDVHGPYVETIRGLFYRYSASGYLDCTSWEPIKINKTLVRRH